MSRVWTNAPWIVIAAILLGPTVAWILEAAASANHIHYKSETLFIIIVTTLAYCGPISLVSVSLGTASALRWYLAAKPGRRLISALMAAAIMTGLVVRNYAWIAILSTPLVQRVLPIIYTPFSTAAVMVFALSPLAFFVVRFGLNSVSDTSISAARSLGAPEAAILWHVVVRRISGAIALASLLVTASSLTYFITPHMLGGDKEYFLGSVIVRTLDASGDFQAASFVGLFLGLPILLIAITIGAVAYFDGLRA